MQDFVSGLEGSLMEWVKNILASLCIVVMFLGAIVVTPEDGEGVAEAKQEWVR